MLESLTTSNLDPAILAPQDRARAVAAILAAGLLRLRPPASRATSAPSDTPENSTKSSPNWLAEPGEKSVTVSAG